MAKNPKEETEDGISMEELKEAQEAVGEMTPKGVIPSCAQRYDRMTQLIEERPENAYAYSLPMIDTDADIWMEFYQVNMRMAAEHRSQMEMTENIA